MMTIAADCKVDVFTSTEHILLQVGLVFEEGFL